MNVRIVVLVALLVVLGGCLGWEPAQGSGDPIVDVKTDEKALGYDDKTPDLSGLENSPPTAVEGAETPEPPTDAPTPAVNDTSSPGSNGTANTTPATTETGTPATTETGTPQATPNPTPATPTDLPSGQKPTPADDSDGKKKNKSKN